jgi:hypothetical protein
MSKPFVYYGIKKNPLSAWQWLFNEKVPNNFTKFSDLWSVLPSVTIWSIWVVRNNTVFTLWKLSNISPCKNTTFKKCSWKKPKSFTILQLYKLISSFNTSQNIIFPKFGSWWSNFSEYPHGKINHQVIQLPTPKSA